MTIAAIVTAPGEAGVSIIKISGSESWAIATKLSNKKFQHRYIELAWINHQGQNLDQVLILPFKAPHSYTGDDLVEIHSHGGIWITEHILELVLEQGARLAKPGEFTQRAVLNHKIDLSQAEAILDIIQANSSMAAANAVRLYEGTLGNSIKDLRTSLLNLLGEVIASIDFPDEVGSYNVEKFKQNISNTVSKIKELLSGERDGHILRHGYKVAIIGKPNAGKSTLLNTLLKKERAIVTDIAGTTRDVIEESYSLKGIPIVLLDTAGIRESDDRVEKIGIERSLQAINEADLVLKLIDLSSNENDSNDLSTKNHLVIGTKSDLGKNSNIKTDINISSLSGTNIDQLKEMIYNKIMQQSQEKDLVKINHRQADLLRKAKSSLEKSLAATSLSEDFWTIDLRAAIQALGEITGETLTEEILDNIFSRFCIGK